MKYKALFLDLDGTTVLHSSLTPSVKVTEAILKADQKLAVCLATGRLLHQVQPIIDHLKLSGLCVIANGIQIYDPQKKKIIEDVAINQSFISEIYLLLQKFRVEIRQFNGVTDELYKGELTPQTIYSFYIPRISHVLAEKIIKELEGYKNISVHKMIDREGTVGLEIAHVNATKLHGIVRLGKLLGIETHEMIGVGDGYNDFPLLMACGLKIAMGNAVSELKAIADFVAPSVEEDGVATVIEKFILEK